jgi:prepilin-type N-terminal cleavage/methylation domain-containing protein
MNSDENNQGFTLIELMVVVVIIGVLSTIAIPQYQVYIRRSRTSEATANINSIALYQEQYFSENNQYVTVNANPAAIPSPDADPSGFLAFDATRADWIELGSIFPDETPLRFQYQVRAGQFNNDATGDTLGDSSTDFAIVAPCDGISYAPDDWVTPSPFSHWFVVIAVGNQTIDSPEVCSLFAKISDRTQIYTENDVN